MVARRQSRPAAPLAGESHLLHAVRPFHRIRLARLARRLPPDLGGQAPGHLNSSSARARKQSRLTLRFLYTLLLYLAAPLVSLLMFLRGLKDRSHWRNFGERLGLGPKLEPSGVWIHAVSVGEVQAAAPLVSSPRQHYPDIPLILTTFTVTGASRARSLFKDGVRVRYIPFDLPGSVKRFFNRVRPRLAVIFETELWPNLYRECGRRRIPLVLASARISQR